MVSHCTHFSFVTMATKVTSFRQSSICMAMRVTWVIDCRMRLECFIRFSPISWWSTTVATDCRRAHRKNGDCIMMPGPQSITCSCGTIWIWIKSCCSVDRWVELWLLMWARIRNIIRNWCALWWRIRSRAYRKWPYRSYISQLNIFRISCSRIWWVQSMLVDLSCLVSNRTVFCFTLQYLSIHKIQYFAAPCLFVSGMADTLGLYLQMVVAFQLPM